MCRGNVEHVLFAVVRMEKIAADAHGSSLAAVVIILVAVFLIVLLAALWQGPEADDYHYHSNGKCHALYLQYHASEGHVLHSREES